MNHQYMILPSNGCQLTQPNNKPNEYVIDFENSLYLHSNTWEVALTEYKFVFNPYKLENDLQVKYKKHEWKITGDTYFRIRRNVHAHEKLRVVGNFEIPAGESEHVPGHYDVTFDKNDYKLKIRIRKPRPDRKYCIGFHNEQEAYDFGFGHKYMYNVTSYLESDFNTIPYNIYANGWYHVTIWSYVYDAYDYTIDIKNEKHHSMYNLVESLEEQLSPCLEYFKINRYMRMKFKAKTDIEEIIFPLYLKRLLNLSQEKYSNLTTSTNEFKMDENIFKLDLHVHIYSNVGDPVLIGDDYVPLLNHFNACNTNTIVFHNPIYLPVSYKYLNQIEIKIKDNYDLASFFKYSSATIHFRNKQYKISCFDDKMQNKESLYIVLPSNSCPLTQPDNNASLFIVDWENPISLNGEWEAALTEFNYTYNPYICKPDSIIKANLAQYRIIAQTNYKLNFRKFRVPILHELSNVYENVPVTVYHYKEDKLGLDFNKFLANQKLEIIFNNEADAKKLGFAKTVNEIKRKELKIASDVIDVEYFKNNPTATVPFKVVLYEYGDSISYSLKRKTGQNDTLQDLLNQLAEFKNIFRDFKLDSSGHIFFTVLNNITRVEIPQYLANLFYFDTNIIDTSDKKYYKAPKPYVYQLSKIHHIYIYSSLIENVLVGGVRVPLLRSLMPARTFKSGGVYNVLIDHPMYIPVASNYINNIEVNIRDDSGQPFNFPYGSKTVLTIHLRKI